MQLLHRVHQRSVLECTLPAYAEFSGFKKGMEDEEGSSDDSEEKTEKKVSKKDEDEE